MAFFKERQDWAITVPKDVNWEDYQEELIEVEDGSSVMNYRLPFNCKANSGDRCFVVHNGKVRGWQEIVGVEHHPAGFTCSTTGKQWPAGFYLQRSGKFHPVDGPEMKGFRGIRRFKWVS